jgi:molybdopterin synthase catalytic subunit
MIELDFNPLNAQKAITFVSEGSVGGINVFIGTVRNETKGKRVVALEFEAYEKMAISELQKITDSVSAKWPVQKVAVLHALGRKKIGDLAVVIAVSAAHRDAAFQACRYIIDNLKETVPIWKKEIFEDGEVWVAAHP